MTDSDRRKTKYKALIPILEKVAPDTCIVLNPPDYKTSKNVEQATRLYLAKQAGWDGFSGSVYQDESGWHLKLFRKSDPSKTKIGQLKRLREIIESKDTDEITRQIAYAMENAIRWYTEDVDWGSLEKVMHQHATNARKQIGK